MFKEKRCIYNENKIRDAKEVFCDCCSSKACDDCDIRLAAEVLVGQLKSNGCDTCKKKTEDPGNCWACMYGDCGGVYNLYYPKEAS